MGPSYSYADELSTPSELGIGHDGSAEGILKAMAGVNYYTDAIGFGEPTMFAKARAKDDPRWRQTPLGIRYFTKTGATCSNGAPMYEYIDTTPPGLPGRVGDEIKRTLGVDMKGLGPGIMYDAAGALDPRPMIKAITGSVYPKCKQVTLPVGDLKGALSSRHGGAPWITEGDTTFPGGVPSQTRWVYDSDLSQAEYDRTLKSQIPREGFRVRYDQARMPKLAATVGATTLLLVGTFMLLREFKYM